MFGPFERSETSMSLMNFEPDPSWRRGSMDCTRWFQFSAEYMDAIPILP
jgi:hypothetical protein